MKVNFRVTGTMEIPDSAIPHEDILNQLYALEFNNKMYMLQMCLVAESPDGEYEMIHQYDEMEQHEIKNVRYDAAEFEPVVRLKPLESLLKKAKSLIGKMLSRIFIN